MIAPGVHNTVQVEALVPLHELAEVVDIAVEADEPQMPKRCGVCSGRSGPPRGGGCRVGHTQQTRGQNSGLARVLAAVEGPCSAPRVAVFQALYGQRLLAEPGAHSARGAATRAPDHSAGCGGTAVPRRAG